MAERDWCRKCAAGVPHEFKHGTTTGYNRHHCRCAECVAARSRSRKPSENYCKRCEQGTPHGFNHGLGGYGRHGCRCAICVTAMREYNNRRYRQSRDAAGLAPRQFLTPAQRREKNAERGRRWREENPERAAESKRRAYYARIDDYRRRKRARPQNAERKRAWDERNREYIKRQKSKKYRELASLVENPRRGPWSAAEDKIILDDVNYPTMVEKALALHRTHASASARRRVLVRGQSRCSVEDCDASACVRGYCHAHYRRWLAGEPLGHVRRVRHVGQPCLVPGCDRGRRGGAFGYCRRHYQQLYRGNPPLKTADSNSEKVI